MFRKKIYKNLDKTTSIYTPQRRNSCGWEPTRRIVMSVVLKQLKLKERLKKKRMTSSVKSKFSSHKRKL